MNRTRLKSDIKRRMANGALWTFTGTAVGKLLVLLAGIGCARLLGKTQFGELGMVRSTIGMFIVFGAAGIGVTATRFIAQHRHTDSAQTASICAMSNRFALWFGVGIMVVMIGCSGLLANNILHSPQLQTALMLGGLMLLGSTLNGSLNGILAGMEDFRSIALCTLVGSMAEATLMTTGAWIYGLEGAVVGFGLGVAVLYIAYHFAVRRTLQHAGIATHGVAIRKKDWQLLLTYSLPAALSALMVTPVFWTIRAMLVRHDGYAELAVFEAADQWKIIIMFVPGAISQIALPILSSMTESQTFSHTLRLHIQLIAGIASLLALLIIVAAPVIMPLYGTDYTNHVTLSLLAVSVVFACVSNVIEMAIYSIGKMWTGFLFNVVWAVATCLLALWLLPLHWGSSALAMAVLLAYLLKTIVMGVYICFTSNSQPL